MKRYTLFLTHAAQRDIFSAQSFYEKESEGLGEYFYDSIVADLDSLQFYAGIHPLVFGFHRKLARRFPFAIYYEIEEENRVVVHAVLHTRRALDPAMLQRRR
jgi:plasmid stabilization system protein ParE